MNKKILPGKLEGEIAAISSKSASHRLLICSALANEPTSLEMDSDISQDIQATIDGLRSLGASIETKENHIEIRPIDLETHVSKNPIVLNCKESGSTLRFLLPVAMALHQRVSFLGEGRLASRPLKDLMDEMKKHGCSFSKDLLPFEATGYLSGGRFLLPGNISSQYITGILLAAPLFHEDTEIRLISPLESSPYVDMTVEAMKSFGIDVVEESTENEGFGCWKISGYARYKGKGKNVVEGDWSNAAFWLCADALGAKIRVEGLDPQSPQGDKAIVDILEGFGAKKSWDDKGLLILPGDLKGSRVDLKQVPDLLPALAIVAAHAQGESIFYNAGRLRLKESDRIAAVKEMVRNMGGKAHEHEDQLIIYGTGLTGGVVRSFEDHRIAMAAAIGGSFSQNGVTITNTHCVEKSYPRFFGDFETLGGKCHGI